MELIQNELKININSGVEHTPNADYSYRMLLRKADWAKVVEKIANDVDYDNFKDSVHEGYGSLRDNAYMGCWWELRKAQERQQETQK